MELLTVLIVGGTMTAFVMLGVAGWLYQMGQEETEQVKVRSRLGLAGDLGDDEQEEALASLIRDEAEDSVRDALGNIGDTIRLTLQQAESSHTVSSFVQQAALIGGVISLISIVYLGPSTFFTGLVAAYIPWVLVKRTADRRAKELLEQMPDALELMGRAMQAGTGLSETFNLVAKEMPEPIASDFGRVYEAVRFGKEWRLALDDLIAKNPTLFDLRLFASSLILQRDAGGNMIETVTRISKLIRQRQVFDAKVKAMSAEARSSGFILAAMPLVVGALVFAAQPSYLYPMVSNPAGQMASVACVASYMVGMYAMNTVSNIS